MSGNVTCFYYASSIIVEVLNSTYKLETLRICIHMKKLIPVFAAALMFVHINSPAQTIDFKNYQLQHSELYKKFMDAFANNMPDSALCYLNGQIALFGKLSIEDQNKNIRLDMTNHYNLACLNSLMDNKIAALDALNKAADMGLNRYNQVLNEEKFTNIRNEERFTIIVEKIKGNGDYRQILREDDAYATENTTSYTQFEYASPDDYRLKEVRKYFQLDSVIGDGDEISKIINLMAWVHSKVKHGPNWPFCGINSIDIYNYHKASGVGVNCRAIATVLNDCYLAMGFRSRIVGCIPKDKNDNESHVINMVYSKTLGKWLWMDATNNAYVTDGEGNLLSIAEVRESLINNRPLFSSGRKTEEYLHEYMAKNLYRFHCWGRSAFNVETNYQQMDEKQIQLIPVGYDLRSAGNLLVTSDDSYFWQAPE